MQQVRRALVAAGLLVVSLHVQAVPAGACSCADDAFGPPKVLFRGRAVEVVDQGHLGPVWTFDVAQVIRGEVVEHPTAEVATGGETSCGLQTGPLTAGRTYEVGAYPGETSTGAPQLFVGYCGGSLRQLQDAPAISSVPVEGTDEPDDPPAGRGWLAVGGLAAVGAGIGGAALARRGRRR